jgi:hypothetical protein
MANLLAFVSAHRKRKVDKNIGLSLCVSLHHYLQSRQHRGCYVVRDFGSMFMEREAYIPKRGLVLDSWRTKVANACGDGEFEEWSRRPPFRSANSFFFWLLLLCGCDLVVAAMSALDSEMWVKPWDRGLKIARLRRVISAVAYCTRDM